MGPAHDHETPTTGRRAAPPPGRLTRYAVPLAVLRATAMIMQQYGREQRECYVWWGGFVSDSGVGQILSCLHPDGPSHYGRVHVPRSALFELGLSLRKLDQILLIELHTHPPGAGPQNEVDANNAASTREGFVSIVVPDFGLPRFDSLDACHVHEYLGRRTWRTLDRPEIVARFELREMEVSQPFLQVRGGPSRV